MPRKTFVAGDVLTASQVNTFLMDQSVMTFADSDARDLAIPTPSEGMVTYLNDTDALEVFDGSSFVPAAPASESGFKFIGRTTATGVSAVNINSVFTSEFDNYKIVIVSQPSIDQEISMRMRAGGVDNTSSNYNSQRFSVRATAATFANGATNQTSFNNFLRHNAFNAQGVSVDIYNPFVTQSTKYSFLAHLHDPSSLFSTFGGGVHFSSLSFDGFSLTASTGTFDATVDVYGYRK